MGAGKPAATGHARFSDRFVERAWRLSMQFARVGDAPEGNPLLQPHPNGNQRVQEEADTALRRSSPAGHPSPRAAPDAGSENPRTGGGRESLQPDTAHLSRPEVRGQLQGL